MKNNSVKSIFISSLIVFGFSALTVNAEEAFEIVKSDDVYSVPEDHGKAKHKKVYSENTESILESGRLFLQANIASYHPSEDDDDDFNEFNPGIGLEYHMDGYYLAGGFFENSIDKTSTYWGIGHERTIGADWFGLGRCYRL